MRKGQIFNVSSLAIRSTAAGVDKLRDMLSADQLATLAVESLPDAVSALAAPLPPDGLQVRVKPSETRAAPLGGAVLGGVSSSTSMDEWGTALTLSAIRQVAEAFTNGDGRDVLWSHFQGGDPMRGISDWRGVIARTVAATIRTAQIERPPFDGAEGYVLEVDWSMQPGNEVASELVARIRGGQKISRSIGFNIDAIQPVYDDNDDLRVILIHSLSDVDHDSATRFPANPDATAMEIKSEASTRTKTGGMSTRVSDATEADPDPVAVEVVPEHSIAAVDDTDPGWAIQGVRSDLSLQPFTAPWLWDHDVQTAILGDGDAWDRYSAANVLRNPSAASTREGYAIPVASMHGGELRLSWEAVEIAMKLINSEREIEGIDGAKRAQLYSTISAYFALFGREAPEYNPPTERDTAGEPSTVSAPVEARSFTLDDLRTAVGGAIVQALTE